MCFLGTLLTSRPPTIGVNMKNVVGPRIRSARYRGTRKVTQEELAARLQAAGMDIDRTAIAKIEAGRRPITDIEIIGICKALGIPVVSLFTEEGDPPGSRSSPT